MVETLRMRERGRDDPTKIAQADDVGLPASWYGGEHQRGYRPGSRGTGPGLHTPQHNGRAYQSESVPREKTGPHRVLRSRFRSDVSGESVGQEGRLPQIPGSECADSWD